MKSALRTEAIHECIETKRVIKNELKERNQADGITRSLEFLRKQHEQLVAQIEQSREKMKELEKSNG